MFLNIDFLYELLLLNALVLGLKINILLLLFSYIFSSGDVSLKLR